SYEDNRLASVRASASTHFSDSYSCPASIDRSFDQSDSCFSRNGDLDDVSALSYDDDYSPSYWPFARARFDDSSGLNCFYVARDYLGLNFGFGDDHFDCYSGAYDCPAYNHHNADASAPSHLPDCL